MNLNFAQFLPLFLLLISCGTGEQSGIPVIKLDYNTPETEIRLSELMDVERIVRLETNSSSLIPELSGILLTREYILIMTRQDVESRILQFTRDGTFVRELSRQGRGPDEFWTISAMTTDYEKNILYYFHLGDPTHIAMVDLNKDLSLHRILIPSGMLSAEDRAARISAMIVHEGKLICFPNSTALGVRSFTIDTTGTLVSSLPAITHWRSERTTFPKAFALGSMVTFVEPDLDTVYMFIEPDLDTTYTLSNTEVIQVYQLEVTEKITEETAGYRVDNMVEGTSVAAFRTWKRKPSGEFTSTPPDIRTYLANKTTNEVKRFTSVYLDSLGFAIEPYFFDWSPVTNGHMAISVHAEEFKSRYKQMIDEGNVPEGLRERLRKYDSLISEGDNPIVLIGAIR